MAVLADARAPVVASVLAYRAGTRDERPGEEGAAHFLEHMMFKGSARFGPGEVDLETRALGGANNAYTNHDTTSYHFAFAADRWTRGLDLEADRMAGLRLDRREVDSERQVILEEIALYEGDPWDALGEAVQARLFASHPYGRPVLGTRDSLAGIDGDGLDRFHRRHYRPSSGVLVIAGDVDPDRAHAAAAERFASIAAGPPETPADPATDGRPPTSIERITRHRGDVARLLLALPAPPLDHPDHPRLRLLTSVLGMGRSSRLHRHLVDRGQVTVWTSTDVHETIEPGMLMVATEILPGVEPTTVESMILEQLTRLADEPPSDAELERARRGLLADWLFAHERVEPRADLIATTLIHHDLSQPTEYLDRLATADRDAIAAAADRWLRADRGAVIGWSLPVDDPRDATDSHGD
ncbi:MAG: pitrilysin family protein [Acidobacteriota bacterium]